MSGPAHTHPCRVLSPAASCLRIVTDTDVPGLQDWAVQLSERNWRSAVLVHNTNLFLHDWLKRAALKEGFCAFCCRSAPPDITPLNAHTLATLGCRVKTTCGTHMDSLMRLLFERAEMIICGEHAMQNAAETILPCLTAKQLSACPLCLYCSLNTAAECIHCARRCIPKAQIAFVFSPASFYDKACKPGKELHPESNSLFIVCPNFWIPTHGCVLTGTSQARRSILSSAACQSAGSALTCSGRQPGTCRGIGKMMEAMTSTAASVLVRLLGAPAPCCTAPRMAAKRASALGELSHFFFFFYCIFVRSGKGMGTRNLPASPLVATTGTCPFMQCI